MTEFKKILNYKMFESYNSLTEEEIDLLKEITSNRWKFNKNTGLIDVYGEIRLKGRARKIKDIGNIKFGNVKNVYIFNTNLTTLKGFPEKVAGDCFISDNKNLSSLEYSPKEVEGFFLCENNSLTSLIGGPVKVEKAYKISNEKNISSIEGIPKEVGSIIIDKCMNLKSIINLDKLVDIDFTLSITECGLTSLEGCPKEVWGKFNCSGNKLTSLKYGPEKVRGEIYNCSYNPLKSFKYVPALSRDGFLFYPDKKYPYLPKYFSVRKPERINWGKIDVLEDAIEQKELRTHLLEILGPEWISDMLNNPGYIIYFKEIWREVEKKEWYNQIKYPNLETKEILNSLTTLNDFGL